MLIQQLTKHYGAKRVVDEVSFEIPKGKVLSLIGPNGAGKSTVMRGWCILKARIWRNGTAATCPSGWRF